MDLPAALLEQLEQFLDEEDAAALDMACTLAAATALDIDALLRWLRDYRGDARRRDLATRRIRAALRLPAMPGAPCRPDPF